MTHIDLSQIRIDGGTQTRARIDDEVVAEYAEAMTAGAAFPPVIVYYDGSDYWLADGFHRVKGADKAGFGGVDAEVRQGRRREAILHSACANSDHGLRRTNADKRRAVMALLNDDEWSQWSDSEIARRCAVNQSTVSRIRKELSPMQSISDEPRTYTTKHGTTATMNTSKIGTRTQPDHQAGASDQSERQQFYEPEPEEEEEPEAEEAEYNTAPEDAVYLIETYIADVLTEVPEMRDRHYVVNEIIKKLRSKAISFEKESVS